MLNKSLILLIGILPLTGCDTQAPDIRTVCQRDGIGNYIIKWEVSPEMNGLMKLYVSDTPDMSHSEAAGYAGIRDGVMTYITNDNISRKYFRLLFDNTYEQTVASRLLLMDSVQNLRDMGGYLSSRGQSTRWGKVFRSGEITHVSDWDTVRLNRLGIKTIIDLRTRQEAETAPIVYSRAKIVHIPINTDMDGIIERIKEERVRKGDASLFMQDLYLQYVTANARDFAGAFDLFLEESNYPVLFCCSLGKDRTGFLAALLLAALDVPEDTIFADYVLTNDVIDLRRYLPLVREMDTDAQEALTVLLSANEKFMELAFRQMKKEYGSVNQYLSEALQLTDRQKERLKDILLF
jgi:protein-tyrosine phosphatase